MPTSFVINPTGVVLRLVITCAFWGGTFIAGRYLAQNMPHFTAAALRFLLALLSLLAYAKWRGTKLPRLTCAQLIATAALGIFGIFVYNAGFFAGLALIPASRAALIVAASPIITLCAVQIIERADWSLKQVSEVMISFMGVVLVVSHGEPLSIFKGAVGRGELYVFGAVLGWVIYTLVIRYRLREVSALPMIIYATTWGLAFLLVPALYEFAAGVFTPPTKYQWAAIAYLGLFGTALSFVWYSEAVASIGAARATQFTNLVPVFGVLFSMLLLREPVTVSSVIGGLLVIGGVTLANRSRNIKNE